MSINNFKPTIWSANVLAPLQKALVMGSTQITNRNYEGEVAGGGDRVKITQIGDVDIGDYVVGTDINYQTMDSAAQFLDIDQQKYFAVGIDDVDAAQANVDLLAKYSLRAAFKIADAVDQFIAGFHSQAGITANLGTTSAALTITAAASAGSNIGIIELFSRLKAGLSKANVPTAGRYVALPPDITAKLSMAGLTLTGTTQQQESANNGFIGRYDGFDIYESNNVVNVGTAATPKYKIMAGISDAITFAQQLTRVEAVRRENQFNEAFRGLHVYGGKVVLPGALACATVTPTAG